MTSELAALADAWRSGDLTLYLGAGVSMANGLPDWKRLVVAMYYDALRDDLRGFPNYLYAIAEWHLDHADEPVEITARKVCSHYGMQRFGFLESLHRTLYSQLGLSGMEVTGASLRHTNRTLDAVAALCEPAGRVRGVVTYNFDDLVEMAVGARAQSIWSEQPVEEPQRLPVRHVHGYVPFHGAGSRESELVFTEEQYHQQTFAPLGWANLQQVAPLISSTVLMIGLSLTDRNMRRLLHAVREQRPRRAFALLRKPQPPPLPDGDVAQICASARDYLRRFTNAQLKEPADEQHQVRRLIDGVRQFDGERDAAVLSQLGVEPIWFDTFDQIPAILSQLSGAA
jgi:hypothetical protein